MVKLMKLCMDSRLSTVIVVCLQLDLSLLLASKSVPLPTLQVVDHSHLMMLFPSVRPNDPCLALDDSLNVLTPLHASFYHFCYDLSVL